MKIDLHLHTHFSDGKGSIREYAQRASELGFSTISITDHAELSPEGVAAGYLSNANIKEMIPRFSQIHTEIEQIRREFPGLEILFGVEIGYRPEWKKAYEVLYKALPFDYVIGSVHQILIDTKYWGVSGPDVLLAFEQYGAEKVYTTYFQALLEMILWGEFDAIGHFDVPKRFSTGFTAKTYESEIRSILKFLAKRGKGIEVNGSGISCPCGDTCPGIDILTMAKEEGVTLVTISSDSHQTEHLGRHTEKSLEHGQKAGFEELTIWRKRIPESIRIK